MELEMLVVLELRKQKSLGGNSALVFLLEC